MKKMSVLFETKTGSKKIIDFKQNDIYDENKPVSKQLDFFNGLCKKFGFKNEDVTRIKFFNGPETIESLALSRFINLKMIEIAEETKFLKWAFLGGEHTENEKSISIILPNSLEVDKSNDGFKIDPFFGCELKYVFIDDNLEFEELVKERHPEAIIIHDRQKFDELVNNNSQDQKTKYLVPANRNDDTKDIKNKSVNKYKDQEPQKNINGRSYSELLNIKSIFLPYFFYLLIIITWHKIFNPDFNNQIQTDGKQKQKPFYKKINIAKEKSSSSNLNKQIPSCSKTKSDYKAIFN